MGDGFEEKGLGGFPWNNGRAGLASDLPAFAAIKMELGFE